MHSHAPQMVPTFGKFGIQELVGYHVYRSQDWISICAACIMTEQFGRGGAGYPF